MHRRARNALRIAIAAVTVGAVVLLVRYQSSSGSNANAPASGSTAKSDAEGASSGSAAGKGTKGSKDGAGPARAIPVLVAAATRRDVPVWLEGLGSVAAWQQVLVRPQVEGILEKGYFKEGQRGRKGQVLAQTDPRVF